MRTVLFIAPFLLEQTLRFVRAAASLPGFRLVVLTSDDKEKLPPGAHHYFVRDATDSRQLIEAAFAVRAQTGGIHRVIGILENIQEQIADVRQALGIPGTDAEIARRFRDKAYMKDLLRSAGVPVAKHQLLSSLGEARQFVQSCGFPIVLKPPAGAGCRSTYQIAGWDALVAALEEIRPTPQAPVLAEQFITGEEHSFDTVVIDGKVVFQNILRYYPTPLEVTRNDWIQWCVVAPRDISGPEYDPIREVGVRVIRSLGLREGMTHMEWFRHASGVPYVGEIAARPPGAQFTSLMSYAHDRSFYLVWAQAVMEGRFEGPAERKFAAGCAYLRGAGNGRVAAVEGVEAAHARVGALVVDAALPVVGRPKSDSYEGDGYVIVRHPDTRVVQEALTVLIETIKVHYR